MSKNNAGLASFPGYGFSMIMIWLFLGVRRSGERERIQITNIELNYD
jgi:hypothetical protein